MFKLYDIVKLIKEDETNNVSTSFHGTIVDVLDGCKAYTVEFFDDNGDSIENALMKEYLASELVLLDT